MPEIFIETATREKGGISKLKDRFSAILTQPSSRIRFPLCAMLPVSYIQQGFQHYKFASLCCLFRDKKETINKVTLMKKAQECKMPCDMY